MVLKKGTYTYQCDPHASRGMKGTFKVSATATPTTTTSPTATVPTVTAPMTTDGGGDGGY
jgi:hypothetical protein